MRRIDGFAPIESYGAIGDGKSVALVCSDGSIDWWAAPEMDSPPLFAALLDPGAGGRFALAPAVPYQAKRRYLPGTNVLETTFDTADGSVTVVDSVNQGADERLPWAELARVICAADGAVPMRWRIAPGNVSRQSRSWIRRKNVPLLQAGDLLMAVVSDAAGEAVGSRTELGAEFAGEFTARPGQDALLALAVTEGAPLVVPSSAEIRARQAATVSAWRRWSGTIPHQEPLAVRSVLALRLLTYAPTGAMAAAATTSLPERLGGERNYDYRYGWIRDTSFVLDSLIRLGLSKEVQNSLAWMLAAIAGTAPDIHPFYGLRGRVPEHEEALDLRGYRDSSPARAGNRAVGQPQWGNYGDLLECVWLAVDRAGTHLDGASADLIASLANRVCDIWPQPDCGIWELDELRHNTFSKAGCWVALDRALRLAESGQISARDAGRWHAERAMIRTWIDEHCWSRAKNSYTAAAGTDELDASLLLLGRTGYLAGDAPEFRATVDAIRSELGRGALVYRRTGADEYEGAFVACSFWLVDALARCGSPDEARQVWRGITRYASDLGLFAEQIDPDSGAFLGNLPQGLSHLALVNASVQLRPAAR